MKIDRKLNLVIPIEREDDLGPLYVHAMPLSLPAFQRHALVIAKTFSAIYTQGLSFVAGPRVAAMLLKEIAEDLGRWDGEDGVEMGLIFEMRRTAHLICPTPDGWQRLVLDDAVRRGLLDEEELSEIEGILIFFMVASAMHRGQEQTIALTGMARIWNAQLSSLGCTAFLNSLPTSTPADSSGERVTALPIAS